MHSTEHELLDAFAAPACAICTLTAGAGRGYLRGVLNDGVNDVRLRDDWRRRGGLCADHWRRWRGLESPALSTSILARDLLAAALDAPPTAAPRCRACEVEGDAERRYLGALRRLPAAALAAALTEGRGFACLRHVRALPDGERRALLATRLASLLDDLDTFVRLSDHRSADQPKGSSGDAWLRALRAFGAEV